MRSSLGCCIVGLLGVMLCQPQQGGLADRLTLQAQGPDTIPLSPDVSQKIQLQWAHEQNLEDTSRLIKLSRELKWELANNDRQVLSVTTVKKMDEIERLIKKIRARVGKR